MLCFFVLLLHNYNLLFNGFPFCTVSYYKYNAIIYYYIVIHRTSSHNSIIATAVHDILQLSPWSAHPFTQLSPGLPVHSLSCPNDCQSIPSVVPMTASQFPQLSQWLPVHSHSCPNDCQSITSVVPMTVSPFPSVSYPSLPRMVPPDNKRIPRGIGTCHEAYYMVDTFVHDVTME